MANKLTHNWVRFGGQQDYIELGTADGHGRKTKIERVPNMDRPKRKIDVYNVPGRNGDIVHMQNAWENVDQSYEIWGDGGTDNFGYKISKLFALNGYQELWDSYDLLHYRLAYFAGPFDVESDLTKRGRATITFSCDPRRFLFTQQIYNITTSGDPIGPNTPYDAKPTIWVHGSGQGAVTIGGRQLYINHITDGMTLDCEHEGASHNGTPLNNDVWGEYPIIPGSFSTDYPPVYFDGGITSLEIKANWWVL